VIRVKFGGVNKLEKRTLLLKHRDSVTIVTRDRVSTSMYSLTFRVRVTIHPAVWTKWNGLVADNVAHSAGIIAGEGSLRWHA